MVRRGQKSLQQDIASPSLAVEGEAVGGRVRRSGPRMLAANLVAITRPAARKFGFADARLLSDWALIMGEALARLTLPLAVQRDKSGLRRTLLLKCSAATAPLVQHYSQQILERVNGHYGFSAITHLRLKQGPLPLPPVPPAPLPPLPEEMTQSLLQQLSEIESEAIRAALFDLGQRILR